MAESKTYRGRLAPSPTGYLHIGHAYTFRKAQRRSLAQNGVLVLRNEDLDRARAKEIYAQAMVEDLRWLGIEWQEGYGAEPKPEQDSRYCQSSRLSLYRQALEKLHSQGFIYPCTCSRLDILRALSAPHELGLEPIYPGTCRPSQSDQRPLTDMTKSEAQAKISWRFRVPQAEIISFEDGGFGKQSFVSGKDFGDFVIWREDSPSYQLAVVVDDSDMNISEVVRGADLLASTARQILIYRALGLTSPQFFHCRLVTDSKGQRLAKRSQSLTLRSLAEHGLKASKLIALLDDESIKTETLQSRVLACI